MSEVKKGISRTTFIRGVAAAILASTLLSTVIALNWARGPPGPEGPRGPPGLTVADFDSGWIDLSDMSGQSVNITHNLLSIDIIVDITGKAAADGSPHQKHLGGGYTAGWLRTHGEGSVNYYPWSIIPTADAGFVIAGWRDAPTRIAAWLAQIDVDGNIRWFRPFDYGVEALAYSVIETTDGGLAMAGFTTFFGLGSEFWLVKTDSSGRMQWNRTYGGSGSDWAYSLDQTVDGGYVLTGYTQSFGAGNEDFWLVKTNATGSLEWSRTYGGAGVDIAYSVVQTIDGGFALAGYTTSFNAGSASYWLVKTDVDGSIEWSETYGRGGAPSVVYDRPLTMIQTSDGEYALAGTRSPSNDGSDDFWLIKTDASGNAQWNHTYGGAEDERAYCLIQTATGGYALAGYTSSSGRGERIWLIRTDSMGNMRWNQTYGEIGRREVATSVVQTKDGGLMAVGTTRIDFGGGSYGYPMVLVKTGVELGLTWTNSTANTVTLYRGATDIHWNYVRVRIWKIPEP